MRWFLLLASLGIGGLHERPTDVPQSIRIVTGHVPEHSRTYDEFLRLTLPVELVVHPENLDAYDRLSRAHLRRGCWSAAASVMRQKLARRPGPEHEYRCHATLGLIHANAGSLDQALAEYEAAAALNPGAFHRARFAVALLTYEIAARGDVALQDENFLAWNGYHLFHRGQGLLASASELTAGIEEMLRSGMPFKIDLYRALGDLHRIEGKPVLAWFCYQQAAARWPWSAHLRAAIQEIERHWDWTADFGAPIESDFRAVTGHAARWQESYQRAELAALTGGLDPSSESVQALLVRQADAEQPALPHFLAQTHRYHSRLPEWFVPALGAMLALAALRLIFGSGWKSRPHIIPPRVRGPGASTTKRATSCART